MGASAGGPARGEGPTPPRRAEREPRAPEEGAFAELAGDPRRRARVGAIELLAAALVCIALIALAVWFFFFAHNPLVHP